MKRLALFGTVCILLLFALLLANRQRKASATYILSQYPQTQTIRSLMSGQLHGTVMKTDASMNIDIGNLLFYSTWFVDKKAHLALHNMVDGDGRTGISRVAMEDANSVLQTESSKLVPARLSALRGALRKLPPSQTPPPLGDLYVLSFYQDSEWQTRIYDKSKLPLEVVAAHKLALTSKMAGTSIKGINY